MKTWKKRNRESGEMADSITNRLNQNLGIKAQT